VNVALFTVETEPSSKSPLTAVVVLPLLAAVPVPAAAAVASRELDVATPEYSRMAKRNGALTVMDTVTVFAPPLMLSA
jgi:hypothetical protein